MHYFYHLFFGFAMASIGVTLPGMINMTSVSMSIKRGFPSGLQFSVGASVTVFLQALIAITFAGYLTQNPEVLLWLKQAAIAIFLILAAVFFVQARKPADTQGSDRQGHAFLLGMGIAGMNVLNIPYYLTFSAFLKANGWISLRDPLHWLFLAGALLGSLTFLAAYARFATYIASRADYFARNINYFLSGLFVLLAVVQVVQLYG